MTASIVIPTRGRAGYLDVALASIVPQAAAVGAEVLVVCDGPDAESVAVADRHGARHLSLATPRGANAARNAGVAVTTGALVVFCDDDVYAPPGWLAALLAGAGADGAGAGADGAADAAGDAAAAADGYEVFGGPIRARLEGGGPRACGREGAPITTLDLGAEDRDVELVWSANMAVRRAALERVGRFEETIRGRGEEEEWLRRFGAGGGRVRYVAGAGLEHRRTRSDARLWPLSVAAYGLGRSARRYDVRRGSAPGLVRELRVLAGCAWHVVRRGCLNGVVLGAHAAGRVWEAVMTALAPASRVPPGVAPPVTPGADGPALAPDDFLSGTSGYVAGVRATTRAAVVDAGLDLIAGVRGEGWRLRRAAANGGPRRRVLVLAVERVDRENILAPARDELLRSRHEVEFASIPVGTAGKFENLNALLAEHPAAGHDWVLALDDDVALPAGFLDAFLFLAERFGFALAQPAHRHHSHAAFAVTRRRPFSVARATGFVEIGPVVAFSAVTFDTLLPFPPLRAGWGLDAHWAALARDRGWRMGVIDATPVRHGLRPIAGAYRREDALAEARAFLAERPYVPAAQAARTLAVHRRW